MPRIQARAGPRHQHSSSPLIQEGQIHHLLGLDLGGSCYSTFRCCFHCCRKGRKCPSLGGDFVKVAMFTRFDIGVTIGGESC